MTLFVCHLKWSHIEKISQEVKKLVEKKIKVCVFNCRMFDEADYFTKIGDALGIEVKICSESPSLETIHLAEGCDSVSIVTTKISRDLIKKLHAMNLKIIATRTVGFDHIDLQAAEEYGIRVSNAAYAPDSVADFTIMLMLMCVRKMKTMLERTQIQDFSLEGLQGSIFSKKKIGIIGTGRIGQTVIRHLSGFGNEILSYSLKEEPGLKGLTTYVSFETLLKESDIISLHLPASEENVHLIDAETLAKMKKGVILINTARGTLLDTQAVIENVENGKIGALALDVIENETGIYYSDFISQVLTNREILLLKSFPNVIVTPHMAFYTDSAVEEMVYASLKGSLLEAKHEKNPWRII